MAVKVIPVRSIFGWYDDLFLVIQDGVGYIVRFHEGSVVNANPNTQTRIEQQAMTAVMSVLDEARRRGHVTDEKIRWVNESCDAIVAIQSGRCFPLRPELFIQASWRQLNPTAFIRMAQVAERRNAQIKEQA